MKKLISLLVMILTFTSIQSTQAEVYVSFENEVEAFVVEPQNTDLFKDFKDLMPGGTYSQRIDLKNRSDDTIDLFFEMKPVSSHYQAALKFMTMTIRLNDVELVSSKITEIPDINSKIKLLELKEKETGTMEVVLEIDEKMNNSFQKSYSALDWVFYVEKQSAVLSESKHSSASRLPFTGKSSYFLIPLGLVGLGILLKRSEKNA